MHFLPSFLRSTMVMGLAVWLASAPTSFASDPAFAPIASGTVSEDAGLIQIPFEFDPGDRAPAAFKFTATSSNSNLITNDGLRVVGVGTNRVLECISLPDASGVTTITLVGRLQNPEQTFTTQFELTVTPVADPPQLEPIENVVLTDGSPGIRVPLRVISPDSQVEFTVQITPKTQWLSATVVRSGSGSALLLVPTKSQGAVSELRVVVQVTARNSYGSDSQSFVANVESPDFLPASRQSESGFWYGLQAHSEGLLRWADVNRDGFPDAVSVINGTVSFNPGRTGLGGDGGVVLPLKSAKDLLWADLDGDGVLDVFGYGSQFFGLFRTVITGSRSVRFLTLTNDLEKLNVGGAAFADLDGNGTIDLIYNGKTNSETKVVLALNDGTGKLSMTAHNLPRRFGALVATDFDGDGRVDVLLTQTNANVATAQVFLNRGLGDYIPGPTVGGTDPVTAAGTADFDGDGVPDVWLVHQIGRSVQALALDLYRQEGGRFTHIFGLSTNEFHGLAAPAFGDYDQDGRVDFIASYLDPNAVSSTPGVTNNLFTWYRNESNGQFLPQRFLFQKSPPQSPLLPPTFAPAVADVDGDGDLDISGSYSFAQTWFSNRIGRANEAPSIPRDLRSLVLGDELYLFWSAATDGNQTAPLTYNVRIGSGPGFQDVMPSHSTTNGVRLLAEPGNVGFRHSCVIRLPRTDLDTVYWSVQAVDASYSAGLFAPDQVLPLNLAGNRPPVISVTKTYTLPEDLFGEIPITATDDRTPVSFLTWRAEAGDSELLPAANLDFRFQASNSGGRWSIRLRSGPDRFGSTSLRVIATDRNGASSTNSIDVSITPSNDLPSLVLEPPQRSLRGQPIIIPFMASDPETSWDHLRYQFDSADTELLPNDHIQIEGAGIHRRFVATPAQARSGASRLRVTVFDEEGASSLQYVMLNWQDQSLSVVELPTELAQLRSANAVDFDGDGMLDIVGANPQGIVEVWRQFPRGIFERSTSFDTGFSDASLIVRDFDGDGDMDVVTSTESGAANIQGTIRLLVNEGGQLGAGRILRTEPGFAHLVALDADGDGSLELLGGGLNLSSFRLAHLGKPAVDWEEPTLRDPDGWMPTVNADLLGSVSVLDWNGDGLTDVVFSLQRGTAWRYGLVWQQEPSGGFLVTSAPWISFTALLGWSDFNNDGLPDVLLRVPGNGSPQGDVPLLQHLDGTFTSLDPIPLTGSAVTGDLGGDGRVDVLGWNLSGGDAPGSATLSRISSPLPQVLFQNFSTDDAGSVRSGDFDGDGNLDLLGSVLGSGQLVLAMNASGSTNQPPSAPEGLRVQLRLGGAAEVSWSTAKDPQQVLGLTYNVRVGTAPGSNDVVSAEALADGRGLVYGPGNAGWVTHFPVHGLQQGKTYYASVQAIDSGYLRSAFSTELSFRITAPPQISAIGDQILPRGGGPVDLDFTVSDAETPAQDLTIRVTSSNPVLLPSARLQVRGEGGQRTLHLDPVPDRMGSAVVTVEVSDGSGLAATSTFNVLVPSPSGFAALSELSYGLPVGGTLEVALDSFDPQQAFTSYTVVTPFAHGTVEGVLPHLTYHPEAGFSGVDRFVARAAADGSWDASIVVTVIVEPSHHYRPELHLLEFLGGRRQLLVRARAAAHVHVERSGDLLHWEPAGDYRLPPSESLLLDVSSVEVGAARFYRVQQTD